MRVELSCYAVVGIDAVPVDVLLKRDHVKFVATEPTCNAFGQATSTRHRKPPIGSGVQVPLCNLAPADLKKDAVGFDLPIALGLLLGSGQVSLDRPGSFAVVGELALTGETRPIKGVLAMALQAAAEQRAGLLVPSANASEAAVVEGLNVYPIGSLAEAVGFLSGQVDMDPHSVDLDEVFQQLSHMEDDFVDVKGQDWPEKEGTSDVDDPNRNDADFRSDLSRTREAS
jgi:magnesium chelatase family protein